MPQEDYRESITRAGAVSLTGEDALPATDTYYVESSIACVTVIQVDSKGIETRYPVPDNIDISMFTHAKEDDVNYKDIVRDMKVRNRVQFAIVLCAVIAMFVIAYLMY